MNAVKVRAIPFVLCLCTALMVLVNVTGCSAPAGQENSGMAEQSSSASNTIEAQFVPYDVLPNGYTVFLEGTSANYTYCIYDNHGKRCLEVPAQPQTEDGIAFSEIVDGGVIIRMRNTNNSDRENFEHLGMLGLDGKEILPVVYNVLLKDPTEPFLIGERSGENGLPLIELFDAYGKHLSSLELDYHMEDVAISDINPANCSFVIQGSSDSMATDCHSIIYYDNETLRLGRTLPVGQAFFPIASDMAEVWGVSGSEAEGFEGNFQHYDGAIITSSGSYAYKSFPADSDDVVAIYNTGSDVQLYSQEGELVATLEGTAATDLVYVAGNYVFVVFEEQDSFQVKAYTPHGEYVKTLPLVFPSEMTFGDFVGYSDYYYFVANGDGRRYYDSNLNELPHEPQQR